MDPMQIIDGMRTYCDFLGRIGACRRVHNQLEGVLRVHTQPAKFGRGAGLREGDLGDPLAIADHIKGKQIGGGQIEAVPLERQRGLCHTANTQHRRCGQRP